MPFDEGGWDMKSSDASVARTLHFARYNAAEYGSPEIKTIHVLLGLIQENKQFAQGLLPELSDLEKIRRKIEKEYPVQEKTTKSVDLPRSEETQRTLATTQEIAESSEEGCVRLWHLWAGLLADENNTAASILLQLRITLDNVRQRLRSYP
jgi:ATP-dependent Clp protease ATP-binding subunit ClpC